MKRIIVKQVRTDKDKNGRPIPIYKNTKVEHAKGIEDVYSGKKKVPIIKL